MAFSREALGRPELGEDPRFTPNARRLENKEELTALVEAATRVFTSSELIERLNRIGIANARMRNMF